MHCQYCGSVDHWSNTCLQADTCPTFKTKNHSLLYICLLLRNTKGQEKDCRGYKSDDPSLVYSKMRGNARNVQVCLVIVTPTPVTGSPKHSHPKDI